MTEPKPKRGMPRSLFFVLIPVLFVVIILGLMLAGEGVQEGVVPSDDREVVE
ncbi:hypothetical protein E0K89_012670 [Aquicoccus sp. SCR17]|nr:hypothetical protein [Carideicomes alvinocaridis]